MGHVCELVDDGILNFNGCVSVGQVEQQRVPGRAFHERADRGLSLGSDDQVTFPVARERPVFHTGGPFADHHHRILESRPHPTGVYGRAPAGSALAHEGSDLFAECAFGLDEDGLVDRLHARVHALIMRETHTQVGTNLFRTPPELKLVPDDAPQTRISAFTRLGTFEALACPHVSDIRVVARGCNPIASELPAHSRGRTPQLSSDVTNRKPFNAPSEDEHAFLERQEPLTDPMRLALHIQTVPMGLRSDTGSLTPST